MYAGPGLLKVSPSRDIWQTTGGKEAHYAGMDHSGSGCRSGGIRLFDCTYPMAQAGTDKPPHRLEQEDPADQRHSCGEAADQPPQTGADNPGGGAGLDFADRGFYPQNLVFTPLGALS
ncbi:hypothetical protein D3C81_1746490 [compost metagenome]